MERKRTILVTGDVTVDWQILQPRGTEMRHMDMPHRWGISECQAASRAGGAALLADLLRELKSEAGDLGAGVEIQGPDLAEKALQEPGYPGVAKTFMSWKPYPRRRGEGREYVWRIGDFLGEDQPGKAGSGAREGIPQGEEEKKEGLTPDVLVIEDANLGFRSRRENWQNSLSGGNAEKGLIFLKVADPLDGNVLLEDLSDGYPDRLTVFTSVSDMRKSGCPIGYAISWEQVYEEVVAAVRNHRQLRQASRVVVSLGPSGAVLLVREGGSGEKAGGWKSWLVFDPENQEGDWEKRHPGSMVGYGTCIAASLIWEMALGGGVTGMVEALKRGCRAARVLHHVGYKNLGVFPKLHLAFPFEEVVEAVTREAEGDFHHVQLDFDGDGGSSILDVKLAEAGPDGKTVDRVEKAMEIVTRGPARALAGVPVERIGKWSSVDRAEIESMRSLSNIVTEYVNRYRAGDRLEKPLSLAVFGPPGSGKSFAIKQMARALYPDLIEDCEFNLSQFVSAGELAAAFHKVRDMVLQQYLPLVFWDEFDTPFEGRELGWLRHFLAPMQDGRFLEGGVFRPIGPAIFVFAGSQYHTMEEFRLGLAGKAEAERASKKMDFLSRLKGFVNILGPNPLSSGESEDRNYILRRAFLLRTILERKAPHLVDEAGNAGINPGVLRAFLEVTRYYYGARSMEAVVEMSTLAGKKSFELSCLPARSQLAMHVDADDFLQRACGQ